MRVAVVSGGLGGARLALALREAGLDRHASFITNVADDVDVGPYLVCPDTDAVLYALTGRFDEERGWGVLGDRFEPPPPGAPSWFGLGELDLATHRARRALLDGGAALGAAMASIASAAGARARVVPATDDRIRTMLRCGTAWLTFQEWLVRDRAMVVPDEVRCDGGEAAQPAPGVIAALESAELVVLAPSSPIASIRPILGLPGVRDALAAARDRVVVVSPIVQRVPPVCERDASRKRAREALLTAAGVDLTVTAIAALDAPIAATFVLDPADVADGPALMAMGYRVLIAPTRADTPERRQRLLEALSPQLTR